MAKTWGELSQHPDFQSLSREEQEAVRGTYFDKYVAPQVAPEILGKARSMYDEKTLNRTWGDVATDLGVTALKGAVGLPEAVVGLADIPTGGRVGKALEEYGYRPGETQKILESWYSPTQKAANKRVEDAEGIVDTTVAAVKNPSVVANTILESLPLMGAGGLVGRGIVGAGKLAGRAVSAPLAAGAGEGLMSAGSTAETVRQQTPDGLLTPEQSALAAGSGALTGAFGWGGGKLAQKAGIVDFETALAGATGNATRRGLAARVAGGAASEGFLEELPQSAQEQALQNIALGKPWDEGLDQAAVLGTLSGGIMGGGMNALSPASAPEAAPTVPPVEPPVAPPGDPTVAPEDSTAPDVAKVPPAAPSFAGLTQGQQQQALQNVAAGKPWDTGLGITDAEIVPPTTQVTPQAPELTPQAPGVTPQAPAIPVVGPLSAAANAGQQASAAGISSTPAPTAEQQAAQQQAQVKAETAAAKDQAALQSAQLKLQQQQQEAAAKQAQQQQDAALKQQQAALKLKQEQLKINQSEQKLGMGPTQFDEPALLGQANDLAALSQPTIDQPTQENTNGLQTQTDAQVPGQVPGQAPNAAANAPAGEVALATTQAPAAAPGQTSAPGVERTDGKTAAVPDTGMRLVHGSGNPNLTTNDIEIVRTTGQKQGKKGRTYGGLYGTSETDAAQAEGYAQMMGGQATLYDINVKPGTKVLHKEGDITRLSKPYIEELTSQGYGLVVGKDPRGRTEYAVIDKGAIHSLTPRGATSAPATAPGVAPLSNNPALAEDQAHVDVFNQANQRLNARKKEATPRAVVRLATEKDLPAAGRGARRLAGAIAAAFGHRVIYIASADEKAPLSFDGSVSPTDPTRIFIANDAEAPVTRVVAHEVLHGLKRVAPDVYDNMLGSLRRLYDPQKVARHAKQRGYQGGLNEANEEEWVADFFSNTLHDPKSLAQVALAMDLKKTGAGLEFLNNLKEFIGRVIAKLRGDQTLGQGFEGADEAVKDLEQARAAVVKAIAEYARARLTGKTAESLGDVPLAARLTPEEKEARAQKKTDDQAAAAKAKNPPLETGNEVTDIYNRRTVSARAPTSPGAKENPVTQDLGLDLNTYLKAPNLLAKVMATLSTYPQLRPARAGTTDEQQLRTFIGVLRDNLLWLHDQVDPKIRERSKLWYDGALKITERAAKRYQVTRRQFAAVLATQSPQKDWFENVSLADRITSIFQRYQNHAWDAKMEKAAARVLRQEELAELAEDLNEDASEASASSSKFINAKARAIATKSQGKVSFERAKEIATAAQAKKNEVNQVRLDRVRGKRLDELYDDLDAAIWVRVFDAAHHSPHYHTVSPEGNFVGIRQAALGPARIRWGTFAGVAKSIAVLKDGTIENISTQLGKEHKIRNFYNNIIAPNDPRGYVTMDTHAIAADMVSPFSGFSIPVSHNFGSRGAPGSSVYGISGTYPIHGEGYTRAAKARDLLPREMQSITWEAIRGMFPAQFKRKPNIDHINALWQDYHDGKLTLAKTREAILEYVKTKTNRTEVEIFAPEWTRSPAAHLSDVSYEELPGMPGVSPANYRAGSGMNVEVAPNPDLLKGAAKGAAAKWGALTAEERRKVTEVVGRPIIKQVMAKLGITQYRPEFTVGGYETEANPSITLHFSPEVSWEQLEEATRVLGYLWKQKEMVMLDETDKTSDGQVTFIQVKPSRPLSAEEISDLYVSTNAAFPAAGGMSVSNGAPVFANFSDLTDEEFEKGLSDAVQKYIADKDYSAQASVFRFRSALIGDVVGQDKKTGDDIVQTTLRGTRYDEETQTTGTGGKDGWRTNGKTSWAGGETLRWKGDFDAIQTAFDQRFQREVGHAHRRVVKQRNAAPLSLRPNAASDRRTGGGPAAQGRPSYGTARPGAVKGTGVHYSRAERQTLDSTKYGTGLPGREAQRIAAAKDARLKQRVYFYINNGTGIHPEQGVGGYTHTVDLNNLYDLDADPQYLYQPTLPTDTERMNAFESAVIDAGFDGYVADFAGQRAAVLLGAHQVPVRFEGMAQRPAVPAGERATPNPLKRVAALLRTPWQRQTPQAFGARIKAADPDLYRQFADQFTASDQTYWPGDMVSKLRDPNAPPRLVFSNRPTVREENLAKREYGAVVRQFTNSDGSRKPGWLKAPNGMPTLVVDGVERSTTNSLGDPLHPTEVGVRNFWRWFAPSPSSLLEGLPVSVVRRLKRNTKLLADFLEGQSGLPKSDRFSEIPDSMLAHVAGAVNEDKVREVVIRSLPVEVVNFLSRKQRSPEVVLQDAAMLKEMFAVNPTSNVALEVNPALIAELLVRVVANAGAKISGATSRSLENNAAVLADTTDPVLGTHVSSSPSSDLGIIAGFDGSKVVDADGRPRVVYHGTGTRFNKVNLKKGAQGLFWFTSDKAKIEAGEVGAAGKGVVMALYAKIDKPADWKQYDRLGLYEYQAKGLDGALLPEANGEVDGFVIDRPTQIKSANTNRGTFDPDNADIRFSNRPTPEPPPAETRFRKAQRVVQDKFNRFRVIQDWLKTQGVQLSEAGDVYRAEERFHARVANQIEDFREATLKPLVAKSQKAGFKMADIAQFLHAQHAEERNIAIAKINPKFPDGGSGMTTAEARTILAAASPELKQIAAEWRQLADDSLELKLQAGLITQEQADAFRAKYAYYVPLRGGPEEQLMVGTGKGLKVRHKEQRALGHPVREGGEWIIEQLLADRESAIMKAEKALIAKHVLQMAVEMQRPDIISVEQPKQRQVLKDKVSYVVTYKGSPIEAFQSLEAARVFRQMAGTQKGNHLIDFDIIKSSDPQVVLMASPRLGDNELMAYVGGHEIRIQINDDLLSRAYGNLGQDALGPILRAGRVLNTWLSKVYTGYNPEFILVNLMRDFTTGIANLSGEQGAMMAMRAVKRYPKAFRDLLRYARNPARATQSIRDYREDGGNTGAAYLDDLERIGTDVAAEYAKLQGVIGNLRERNARGAASSAIGNTIKPLVSWIEKLNQAGENAMRLAIYQAMRDSGKGRVAAASAAKNTTVNFNRKGELGLALNAWWLFFNAAVQGTSSIAHAHFKGAHKGQAWAFSSGLIGTMYLASLLAAGDDEDDDEYEKISEYDRSRNLIIRTKDGFVKLPIPYGYGFFANLGRGLADAQRTGEVGKLPWHLATSFIEEYTPFGAMVAGKQPDWQQVMTFMGPTAWQIGAVPAYNRTSFGTPLYPTQAFKTEEFARDRMWRGTKGTWADELAGALETAGMDVSPETLKHLWRTATGGAGTFVTGLLDAGQLKARGADDLDAREVPLLRKFLSVPGVQEARARYYEAVEESKIAKETFARFKKQGRFEEMETYQGENEALISMAAIAEKTSKRIKKARDLYDAVKLDETLPLPEKRRQLREMEVEETRIYDDFVRMFQERTRVAPR